MKLQSLYGPPGGGGGTWFFLRNFFEGSFLTKIWSKKCAKFCKNFCAKFCKNLQKFFFEKFLHHKKFFFKNFLKNDKSCFPTPTQYFFSKNGGVEKKVCFKNFYQIFTKKFLRQKFVQFLHFLKVCHIKHKIFRFFGKMHFAQNLHKICTIFYMLFFSWKNTKNDEILQRFTEFFRNVHKNFCQKIEGAKFSCTQCTSFVYNLLLLSHTRV